MEIVEAELRWAPYTETNKGLSGASWTRKVRFESGRYALQKYSRMENGGNDQSVRVYQLSQWLGFGRLVPITVSREEDGKNHTFMEWRNLPELKGSSDAQSKGLQTKSVTDAVILDMIISHQDRHYFNWLADAEGHVVLLDNEAAFPDRPNWYSHELGDRLTGLPIVPRHVHLLHKVQDHAKWPKFLRELDKRRQQALLDRVSKQLEKGCYV